MALDLNEYIKVSYERPNRKVLEGLGASEDLIEYLMETPGNTNWNVIGSIMNSGGEGDAEVWFVGDTGVEQEGMKIFTLNNVDATDHVTELFDNSENYKVYLNGEELPYYQKIEQAGYTIVGWTDTEDSTVATKNMAITKINDNKMVQVVYMDASTAPTSVEASVKAK